MITTSQLQSLRRLVEEEGHSRASAARALGLPYHTAYYYCQLLGVQAPLQWGPDKLAHYGAYDRKTDELVAMGTGREVAAQLGITRETLRSYVTTGRGKYQIVRLDEPDGEEWDVS